MCRKKKFCTGAGTGSLSEGYPMVLWCNSLLNEQTQLVEGGAVYSSVDLATLFSSSKNWQPSPSSGSDMERYVLCTCACSEQMQSCEFVSRDRRCVSLLRPILKPIFKLSQSKCLRIKMCCILPDGSNVDPGPAPGHLFLAHERMLGFNVQ